MEEIKKEAKKYYNLSKKFLSQKKVQNIIVIVLLLGTLFLGAAIRLQPIVTENLIDSTTGDYTPLALDPYYFLRVSETLIETGGDLPTTDEMRYPALNPEWHHEILPESTVLIYKVMKVFDSEVTLNFANVTNPVIFFVLGLLIFFILCWVLTKNKWLAIIASLILTIIPPYLYRTLAGFSDHESIGMFGFFLSLLVFAIGMFYLDKKKSSKINSGLIGIAAGFFTSLAIVTWTGGAKFLFMIFPLAFIVYWLIKDKQEIKVNHILFYALWILGTVLGSAIFSYSVSSVIKNLMFNTTGILTFFVLGYIIIESILTKYNLLNKKLLKYKELISAGGVLVLGAIVYQLFIGNAFQMIKQLISSIINPFGTGRVGLTVAENKQPYLNDWISQISKTIFYTFLAGCLIVGGKLAKGIKKKKFKPLFISTFAFFILGILFSRISASSILNGDNFLSGAFFFISFLTFAISSIYIYTKSDWKIETKWIFIAAWMIPMLLAVRSAIRVFFAIVPFVAFMVPLTLFEIGKWAKKSKDSMLKLIGYLLLIILIIGIVSTSIGFYKTVKTQATYQTPSYNSDWQKGMSWVRDNTPEGSIFLHWWDYGYWVQTGGNRPTVTDGGHFNGYWDHLIGRYVLTTPFPETAKSFMKSHDVSYLLIDPTDIGKYSAYSSIGDDKEESDRASFIVTFVSDPRETQETRNETIRLYRGGIYLDTDIHYKDSTQEVFLPEGRAAMGGITISKTSTSYSQPMGIYVLNGKQYSLPIRYLFIGEELYDFENGVNATAYVYPNIYDSGSGQQFDMDGAVMYLSEKTMNSLIAKLYLMNDPNDEYGELELVHEESVYPFKFHYGGFRGPIAIWEVKDMPNILVNEEFTYTSGEYGELDDLMFTK